MMKSYFSIIFFLLCVSAQALGQKHDYNWALGDPGPHVDDHVGFFFSFSTNPISFPIKPRNFFLAPLCTTISDIDGNIQFYSNGCEVINWNDSIMENGHNINPGVFHDNNCGAGYPTRQNIMAVPIPNKEDEYYLFHSAINDDYYNGFFYIRKHYYSHIDMTKLGGFGEVTKKNELILTDTMAPAIAATKHSNGIDWWIHYWRFYGDQVVTFLAKEDTIEGPFYQSVNLLFDPLALGGGISLFSPDGTKYVYYDTENEVNIFDFDRSTGLLANHELIIVPDSPSTSAIAGGAAISPNNRFLYISNSWDVYQFDLWEDDIESSKVHLAHYDLVADPFPTSFYAMQLGPDCRIYITTPSDTRYLHVIHNPDEKGLDCNFETRGVKLPSGHNYTIPFFPNYRLGETYSYPCDSTLELPVTALRNLIPPNQDNTKLRVFPNPTHDILTVNWAQFGKRAVRIKIQDLHGRIWDEIPILKGHFQQNIKVEGWPHGIYFGSIQFENGIIQPFKFVIEGK